MCLDVHFKVHSADEGSMQIIGSTTELQERFGMRFKSWLLFCYGKHLSEAVGSYWVLA